MENNKKFHETIFGKTIIILIVLGFLSVCASGVYYYLVYIPEQEQAEQDREEQEANDEEQEANDEEQEALQKSLSKTQLDSCLKVALSDYISFWDTECEGMGRSEDCILPEYNADRVDSSYEDDKDDCYKKYPQQ